jgi:hypothetical protein
MKSTRWIAACLARTSAHCFRRHLAQVMGNQQAGGSQAIWFPAGRKLHTDLHAAEKRMKIASAAATTIMFRKNQARILANKDNPGFMIVFPRVP